MSSSVSVLFHTSFPPQLLDENHPVLVIYFVGVSFKLVSFSSDAMQAFSGLQLGSTQPWNISVWSSHSRKPRTLAGSWLRPLAEAFKSESNRSSCYFFCLSASTGLVAQGGPDFQDFESWEATRGKHRGFEFVIPNASCLWVSQWAHKSQTILR